MEESRNIPALRSLDCAGPGHAYASTSKGIVKQLEAAKPLPAKQRRLEEAHEAPKGLEGRRMHHRLYGVARVVPLSSHRGQSLC